MKSPLVTMSAITGRPSRDYVQNYMKALKENGIEQVMAYPRSGCELEYLSDEWFNTVEYFLECAKQLDMNIWLYDDFNWPSGDAGGIVTKKYTLRSIIVAGENIGEISTYSEHNGALFGRKPFPDLLSFDAVDCFINSTHEQYYKRFKKYFGSTIKGIFTDEPCVGYCCYGQSVPYYDELPDDYRSLCGNDFYEDMKLGSDDFFKTVMAAVAERFKVCFVNKIRNWCEEHGVEMGGHLAYDSEPFNSTKYNGNLLKVLSSFSIPGVDDIRTNPNHPDVIPLFGAAQYAKKGKFALTELFALGPCDMSYALRKNMIYFSSCFKINLYFLAISHLDMRGNTAIKDYFNDFSISQPDFSGMKLLACEAKKAAEYADKDFTPDIYVEYPLEVCSAKLMRKDFDSNFYMAFLKRLAYYQIQWKFVEKGDDTGDIKVVRFTMDNKVSYENITTRDLDEICKAIKSKPFVYNVTGELCENIFSRKYDDGSFVVVNLVNEPLKCIINNVEKEIDGFGVVTDRDMITSEHKKVKAQIDNFDINYCNKNIIRLMYVNDADSAVIRNDSSRTVEMILRNDSEAYIDDEIITAQNACTEIPLGMQNLYKVSSPMTLGGGSHVIKSGNDFKYMPSVLVMGDFDVECISGEACEVKLSKRKTTLDVGDYVNGFGKTELSQKVFVPEEARFLELKGTTLYTCVSINGKMVGEKICSPYIYEIDREFCGKLVDLKIVQYSSLGPVFGDVEYWDNNSQKVSWKGIASPKKAKFGVTEAEWLL